MLRIGNNQYEQIRVHSGFTAYLFSKTDSYRQQEQLWIMEAHFVPAEPHYTPRPDGKSEYLKFGLRSETYSVPDWRHLTGLGLDTADDSWMGMAWLENLLFDRYKEESLVVRPGWLEVEPKGDYLFRCKFDGSLVRADDTEEEMEFEADIPLREVVVHVPINAADPLATGRAMAAQLIHLTESTASRVQKYDPAQRSFFNIHVNTHHVVTLETPWRQSLV